MKTALKLFGIATLLFVLAGVVLTACASDERNSHAVSGTLTSPTETEHVHPNRYEDGTEADANDSESVSYIEESTKQITDDENEETSQEGTGSEQNNEEVNTQVTSVDIQTLLWADFFEVQNLLGNLLEEGYINGILYRFYRFDTGIEIGVDEAHTILSINVEYGEIHNGTAFIFREIDGTSSYDDVVAVFGSQPYDGYRQGTYEEERVGATKSYGFWAAENEFARFFFDDSGLVVAIRFSIAYGGLSPQH